MDKPMFKNRVIYKCKNEKEMEEISSKLKELGFNSISSIFEGDGVLSQFNNNLHNFGFCIGTSVYINCIKATSIEDFYGKALYDTEYDKIFNNNKMDKLENVVVHCPEEWMTKVVNKLINKNKVMRKEDLKSGMSVELRNGDVGLLVDTEFGLIIQYEAENWDYLNEYKEDLTCLNIKECDIVKVRKPLRPSEITRSYLKMGRIIWERNEAKEMTVEEISKALGYNVKIVKG